MTFRIPRGPAEILRSLRFRADPPVLSEAEWRETLAWCDRTQLTLSLAYRHRAALPDHVQSRLDRNLESNRERTRRIGLILGEALAHLRSRGLDPVLLKGFAHAPHFVPDPCWRAQSDFDFLLSREEALAARDALASLGYEPLERMERFPTDHLPALVRKTGWLWRGDYFDPEAPPSIDLHFRLWDWETEGFDAPGWELFRARSVRREWNALEFAALDRPDAIAYAALHALRHLLRGSLRPFHAYEIAAFLDATAEDPLWLAWSDLHDPALRRPQAVMFALAGRWFGPKMPGAVREEVETLPAGVAAWLDRYSAAPLEALFRPNKHELWLNLELAESAAARRSIARRRIVPLQMPAPADASILLPESSVTAAIRVRRAWSYARLAASRVWHHARTLPSTAFHGASWLANRAGLREGFGWYLLASCLFAAGVFVFLLLYNLHLLGLGYQEDFLGQVSAAATLGGIAGTLPIGWVASRFGLRVSLLATLVSVAALAMLRAVATGVPALLATAFAGGAAMSGWAVQLMPAVAQLTTPEGRARGFSLFASAGIATGAVAGIVGGRLPRWIEMAGVAAPDSRLWAILLGCAITASALIPAWRVRFSTTAPPEGKSYPFSPFVLRFLAALSVWHLATGAFNPFFNAWLVRHAGASESATGAVFSASQLTQVFALLAAPAVLRRFGVIAGVASMQAATAAALAVCALAVGWQWAAAGYVAYMAAQYMSEPGMFTLLMDRVPEHQRSGASALHFLTIYLTHAVAAITAGAAYSRWGYPAVLMMAASIVLAGAILFRRLLNGPR